MWLTVFYLEVFGVHYALTLLFITVQFVTVSNVHADLLNRPEPCSDASSGCVSEHYGVSPQRKGTREHLQPREVPQPRLHEPEKVLSDQQREVPR